MNTETETKERTLTITRTINAPRELVWKAWTNEKLMTEWWGPRGFTSSGCKLDPRPGGVFEICMDHPDFPNHWSKGEFVEVKKPEKIVFTSRAFIDESGKAKLETINTVTLEEIGGKTKFTLHAMVTKATPEMKPALDGMNQGWNETIDKLANLLETLK
jgi:uncharacterized protein YndB with AHSA1/START domain